MRVSIYTRRQRVCIALLLLLCVSACAPPKTAQDYFSLGLGAVASEQYEEALLQLKNALQENPDFTQARIELGKLYLTQGDLASAAITFERAEAALGGVQERNALVPLLAVTYYYQRDDLSLQHLMGDAPSSDVQGLSPALYDILMRLRNGQAAQAETAFRSLSIRFPDELQACALCLYTRAKLQSAGDPAEALGTLDSLLSSPLKTADEKKTADETNAASAIIRAYGYLLRGQLYFALRDPGAAMQDFESFESLQPRAPLGKLLLAATALQLREIGRAEAYVDTLLLNSPDQPFANTLKAIIAFEQKNYMAAKRHAETSIDRGLSIPVNNIVAGLSAYHENQPEMAYRHVKRALIHDPGNDVLQRLKMVLDYKFGYLEDASDAYLTQNIDSVREGLFGNAIAYQLLAAGESTKALGLLDHVQRAPASSPVTAVQSQALRQHVTSGAVLPAIDDASILSDNETLLQIVMLIQSDDVDGAFRKAEHWLASAPGNVDALTMLAVLHQRMGNTQSAASLFARAGELDPDNVPSLLFAAQQALAAGQHSDARAAFDAVLTVNPNHLVALRGILQLTFEQQQPPDWATLLAPLDLHTASDDHLVAIADAAFKWQQPEVLDALFFSKKAQSQWSPMLWMLWLKTRYSVDGADAFPVHADYYLDHHASLSHVLYALSILEAHGDYPQLLTLIGRLPDDSKATEAIQIQLAAALLETGAYDEARAVLARVEETALVPAARGREEKGDKRGRIGSANLWYVKGRLKEKEGDLVQAASYLRAYYQASPSFHSATHLASVLIQAERLDEAAKLAHAHADAHPSDSSAILALGLKLAPLRPDDALRLLQSESLRRLIWNNAKLSNNLALLYFSAEDHITAASYSANALALDGDNNRIRLTHATILVALGRRNAAEQVLARAPSPDDGISSMLDKLSNGTALRSQEPAIL